jgi:hypothetical protein
MRIIKNKPDKYLKRSDLSGPMVNVSEQTRHRESGRRSRDFASAEIDKNFYVVFRSMRKSYKPK